jgi:hypothetical protein
MTVFSSSYFTIPLRYGGLGMDSHLPLALRKLWPAPPFSCVLIALSNALLVVTRGFQALLCFFKTWKQNLSSQFVDLDIENLLGGGTPR